MSQRQSELNRARSRAARLAAQGVTIVASPFTPRDVLDQVAAQMEATGGIPNGSEELADGDGNAFFLVNLSSINGNDLIG